MNTRIKDHFIPDIGLQATADLFVLFKYTNFIAFPAQYICTNQAAHAAADDHYVEMILSFFILLLTINNRI